MSDNNSVFREIEEEHLDMMIRLALKQAEAEGLLDDASVDHAPVSEEEIQRTYELFLEKTRVINEQKAKEEKRKKRRRAAQKTFRVLACVILLLAIATPVAIASITPLRENIAGILVNSKEDHMELQFIKDTNIVPEGWPGLYYPTYIPEGYTMNYLSSFEPTVGFVDENKNMFYFSEYDEYSAVNVDSEGAAVQYEVIDGMNALILTEEDRVIIVWNNDERMFIVMGFISVAEAERIVAGVKRVYR